VDDAQQRILHPNPELPIPAFSIDKHPLILYSTAHATGIYLFQQQS
jgi:hypothetical protein